MQWLLFIPALAGFLFVNLTLAFTLNGGISRKLNPLTMCHSLSFDGFLEAEDIAKAIFLSGLIAIVTGLAHVSGVWGLIAFIVAIGEGIFYVKWSWDVAETIAGTVLFMFLILGVHFVGMSGLTSLGRLFGFGVESVLKTIECLVLIAAEAFVVVNVLLYHYKHGRRPMKQKEVFRYSAIAVIIIAVILIITTIVG